MLSGLFALSSSLVLAQSFLGGSEQPSLTEKVALYSKPSVVRILSGCSITYETSPELGGQRKPYIVGDIGTGFFIDSEGYILTNAHVVDASQGGENGCKEKLFNNLVRDLTGGEDPEQVALSRKEAIKAQIEEEDFEYYQYVFLPNSKQDDVDALLFDITEIGNTEPGTGNDIAVIKIQLSNTPVLKIADSNNVSLGDTVTVIGYPNSGDKQTEFDNNSILVAGVFEGGVTKTDAVLKDNTRVLELDVSVGYGSSGSPVLDAEGNVVGMVTFNADQAAEQANQGNATPLALRTSELSNYVRRSGADNEQGTLDTLYRDGLAFLWSENYESARSKLESVQDLFPQHSEVEPLLQDVRKLIAEGEAGETDYTPYILGILGGACLLGIGYWFMSQRSAKPETVPSSTATNSSPDASNQLSSAPKAYPLASSPQRQTPKQATVVATDPYVELRNQSGQKQYLYLKGNTHTIGRDHDWSDVKDIADSDWPVISRRQATLCKEGKTYRIYDGDKASDRPSSNGVFVGGDPIDDEGYVLRNGDRLVIGGDPRTQVFLTYYNLELD